MVNKQVGGTHYQTGGEEHWDRIYRLYGRGYFVGCATKYIERYHLKNGKQDLEKAIHFLEKLKELEYPEKYKLELALEQRTIYNELFKEVNSRPEEPGRGYVKQD